MGNNESQNKDTISKLQQFQQQQPTQQNMQQYYTNQGLSIHDMDARGGVHGNPWEAQQRHSQNKDQQFLNPTQSISGIKNEIFLDKSSIKLIPIQSESSQLSFTLTFTFDSLHDCSIQVYQGCLERQEDFQGSHKVTFVPKRQSIFETMPVQKCKFSAGKQQKFPENVVIIDLNHFFKNGEDYSKALMTYYPVVIYMKQEGESQSQSYESIYYLQFTFSRGQSSSLQVLKQKIIFNGQLFELTEAYGLNTSRTDDSNSTECVICLTNPKDTISKPCKHVSLCNACAYVVFNSERKCPICRQGISEIIPFKVV